MPLSPASFDLQYLESMSICATTDTVPGIVAVGKTAAQDTRLAYADPGWMQLVVNTKDDPSKMHMHFNFLRERLFKPKVPTQTATLEEILGRAGFFIGKTTTALITGKYKIPMKRVNRTSSFLSLLGIRVDGPPTIQLTGAEFKITQDRDPLGHRLKSIKWSSGADIVNVDVIGDIETVVNESYLLFCTQYSWHVLKQAVLLDDPEVQNA
jgi:hypothetical protein